MATLTKWPSSTREWICGSTTNHAIKKDYQQPVDETTGLRALSRPAFLTRVARDQWQSRRQPNRVRHPFYRRLDASLSRDHAHGNSSAQTLAIARDGSVSPHVWAVRVLLWLSPLPDVYLAGQILRLGGDGE